MSILRGLNLEKIIIRPFSGGTNQAVRNKEVSMHIKQVSVKGGKCSQHFDPQQILMSFQSKERTKL